MTGAVPEHIGRLPDREAVGHLTEEVLLGAQAPPQKALAAACRAPGSSRDLRAGPVREVVQTAMDRFAASPTESDAWLAPRLHASLRLLRSEAADTELWNFVALLVAPDYVRWRWGATTADGAPKPVNRDRFRGPNHTQAFARLWWAAEVFRNGDDYRSVAKACTNQEFFHNILRLDLVHHRTMAQALIRFAERRSLAQTREINALSRAVNAAGSTLVYEALAPDSPRDTGAYRDWTDEADEIYLPYGSLPKGPDDGRVAEDAVEVLLPLVDELYAEASVRGRTPEESNVPS
ncbi:DUF6339 family protein [Streptomonospora salina]|uniref:Uncharacterized protein n=1 Tax=Streptomonospora salina TaxID=104205 RepID=A0A841E5E7_9ACTN|nr:DUF6339 family protein [Streptomonospora salina]MBB5998236.1 hypothetical protein [Streptomonospora salina]